MTTPEITACQLLLGEKLGSIRSIHYLAELQSAPPKSLGALEIETKTGRFMHILPLAAGGCRIDSGPVPAPSGAARSSVRHWIDLTADVPYAFDDRPVVDRAEPLRRHGKTCGCSIEFSSGMRLIYEFRDGEPRLASVAKETARSGEGTQSC
ncbi:MAG: hypothetical protein O7B25_01930 [Gammaproteobacteria bacterium]|nr:hypothetical protein [Gammaproteobacteria bacterium]